MIMEYNPSSSIMDKMKLNGTTKIFAIIGYPISHSASPQMHNLAYIKSNINAIYIPFQVHPDQIKEALQSIKTLNISGINVTIPHKESVIPYLDMLDPFAKKVKAVNTIILKKNKLKGFNTDGPGFILDLEKRCNFNPARKKIVIFGAGGSAKSIAFACAEKKPAQISIINRTLSRAEELLSSLQKHTNTPIQIIKENQRSQTIKDSDLIINTTSLGLTPNIKDSPLTDFSSISAHHICYDIIYTPSQTRFLREASKKGAKTFNGFGMLAYQGALAFKLMTGKTIDIETMKEGLMNHVNSI